METYITAKELYDTWVQKDIPPKVGTIYIDIDGKKYKITKVFDDSFEVEDYVDD